MNTFIVESGGDIENVRIKYKIINYTLEKCRFITSEHKKFFQTLGLCTYFIK